MYQDDGYTYQCDICEKTVKSDSWKLPQGWTSGHFKHTDGSSWEPRLHFCCECWAAPKIQAEHVGGIFRKLAKKFNWKQKIASARESGGEK